MEILDRIKLAYYEVNNLLLINHQYEMVNKKLRDFVYISMMEKLNDVIDKIICDESNNPPDIVDDGIIICRVIWNIDVNSPSSFDYIDLPFGKLNIINK